MRHSAKETDKAGGGSLLCIKLYHAYSLESVSRTYPVTNRSSVSYDASVVPL